MPVPQARDWLMTLSGVGYKTANCVLLFALGKPALPVDTHIYMVSRRLGLTEDKSTVADAHRILESLVPPESVFEFHVLMIEHGRRTCAALRPRCLQCVLNNHCPGFLKYTVKPAAG
jgi:endonuclease-3